MSKVYSRREFLFKNMVGSAGLLGGGWLLAACKLAPATGQNGADQVIRQEQLPAAQQVPAATDQDTPKPAAQQAPKNAAAANGGNPCDDLTGVAPGELDKRKKFAYVNVSPLPDSRCGNCKLFLPPGAGKACGACLLFKGPVRESGYCTYWAPLE